VKAIADANDVVVRSRRGLGVPAPSQHRGSVAPGQVTPSSLSVLTGACSTMVAAVTQ